MTDDEIFERLIVVQPGIPDRARWGLLENGKVVLMQTKSTSEFTSFIINTGPFGYHNAVVDALAKIFPSLTEEPSSWPLTHRISGNDCVLFELLEH